MIITDLCQRHRQIVVSAPTDTRSLPVHVFGTAVLRGTPLGRGIRFHEALAVFLETGRLLGRARSYYPFFAALRSDLRSSGFSHFATEVVVQAGGGVSGRADLVATGPCGRRAVVEVKTSLEVPAAPVAAHVAQAALYASGMPGAGLILAYVGFQAREVRVFAWGAQPACDVTPLLQAA